MRLCTMCCFENNSVCVTLARGSTLLLVLLLAIECMPHLLHDDKDDGDSRPNSAKVGPKPLPQAERALRHDRLAKAVHHALVAAVAPQSNGKQHNM